MRMETSSCQQVLVQTFAVTNDALERTLRHNVLDQVGIWVWMGRADVDTNFVKQALHGALVLREAWCQQAEG